MSLFKKPKAPPPPDYLGLAREQGMIDERLLTQQTVANRPNIYTPYVSTEWIQTPGAVVAGTAEKNGGFDEAAYLAANKDVADAIAAGKFKGTAQDHYNKFGVAEGREAFWKDYQSPTEWEQKTGFTGAAADAQQRMEDSFASEWNGPRWNDMQVGTTDEYIARFGFNPDDLSGMLQTGFSGSFGSSAGAGNFDQTLRQWQDFYKTLGPIQEQLRSSGYAGDVQQLNQEIEPFLNQFNWKAVRYNPEFDEGRQDEYTKAAYEAKMALLRDQMDSDTQRIQNSLQLQGLMPGTEAWDNAIRAFEQSKAAQLNQLASQSVLTGQQMNLADYEAMLADVASWNDASNAAFGQATGAFDMENRARTQALMNALARMDADLKGIQVANQGRDMAFNWNANRNRFNLEAQDAVNRGASAAANAAADAERNRLAAIIADNESRQKMFSNAIALNGIDYSRALNDYDMLFNEATADRYRASDELGKLLGLNPSGPVPNSTAGNTQAPNLLGAAQSEGNYKMAKFQQDMAGRNATLGSIAQLAGTIGGAFIGGPAGAAIGGAVGKAATGG